MIFLQTTNPTPVRFLTATRCDDVTCVVEVQKEPPPAVVYILLIAAILFLFIAKLLPRRP